MAQNDQNMNYYFFAKTLVQPLFSYVFLCFPMFFQGSTIVNDFFFMFFLEAIVANDYFPTIAIVGANDDRRRSFAQVYTRGSIY